LLNIFDEGAIDGAEDERAGMDIAFM